MRFTRKVRYEDFNWTPRSLAMAKSKPARQQKKMEDQFPLLAAVLPPPAAFNEEQEFEQRRSRLKRIDAEDRARCARLWRACRRDFFAATDEQKEAIRKAWAAWQGPTTGLYFRYVVDVATGVYEARSNALRAHEAQLRREARARMEAQGSFEL